MAALGGFCQFCLRIAGVRRGGGGGGLEDSAPDVAFCRCSKLRGSRESAFWRKDQILVQVAGVPALFRCGMEVAHGGFIQGKYVRPIVYELNRGDLLLDHPFGQSRAVDHDAPGVKELFVVPIVHCVYDVGNVVAGVGFPG